MAVSWRAGLRRAVLALIAVSLVVPLVACGGDSSPTVTPTPTPVPTPPPPRVVAESSWSLEEYFITNEYFDIPSTGTIDVTVSCTFEDTWLQIWIAAGVCGWEQFMAEQCEFVATSGLAGRTRTVSATNQPAGTYTLFIWNAGPHYEQGRYQIVFTAQAGATTQPGTRQRHPDGARVQGPIRFVPAGS